MPPKFSDEPLERIVHRGTWGKVVFARCAEGAFPAEEFYNGLPVGHQAKFMSLFVHIVSNPTLSLNNQTKFKQVEGDLYEFKVNSIQSRIFCFREGNVWNLVYGFGGKKENDLPSNELAAGKRRLQEAKAILQLRRRK